MIGVHRGVLTHSKGVGDLLIQSGGLLTSFQNSLITIPKFIICSCCKTRDRGAGSLFGLRHSSEEGGFCARDL